MSRRERGVRGVAGGVRGSGDVPVFQKEIANLKSPVLSATFILASLSLIYHFKTKVKSKEISYYL